MRVPFRASLGIQRRGPNELALPLFEILECGHTAPLQAPSRRRTRRPCLKCADGEPADVDLTDGRAETLS